jgi:hypothetical protein
MALIVQKFGGTSVADIERIKRVATLVKRDVDAGHQVIVVVSAMAGVTNQLVDYCASVSDLMSDAARANADHVVAAGEQITSGLLALELQSIGLKSRAWAGWQIPLSSDGMYSKARIAHIDTKAINASLAEGHVAVVAGFQGISPEGRITTLGRGGSDTSAVAIAASTRVNQVITLLICCGVFLFGLVSEFFLGKSLADAASPLTRMLAPLYVMVPNLQVFWAADALSQGNAITLEYFGSVAAYAAVLITGLLALAVLLFQRRDVG